MPTAKRGGRLPVVLSREDIQLIIKQISNRKHRLMILLAYGAGLRVSEVVKLRVADIDVARGNIRVVQGKGNRDRLSLLPESLTIVLADFVEGKELNEYVFTSERGGRLHERSLQLVFSRALKRSGIKK